MEHAQVAVADYRPVWWPAHTFLLIRRSALTGAGLGRPAVAAPLPLVARPAGTAIPRAGQSRCDLRLLVHPDEPGRSTRTGLRLRSAGAGMHQNEDIFRHSKHGAALLHLPSGYPQVNTAWMWGRCSPPAWPPGCTSSPPTRSGKRSWPVTASAALRP
jgi:hypothetical protein